jgi:hypothetical protein
MLRRVAGVKCRLPKRRGSLKRSAAPSRARRSTWSCVSAARRRQHAQAARHAEVQHQRAAVVVSISRYLARRPTRHDARPATSAGSAGSTGQRRRGSCTSRPTMRRPTTCGSMPRRVVSTSGSSGTRESLAQHAGDNGRRKRRSPLGAGFTGQDLQRLAAKIAAGTGYLIFVSLYATCLRTTGSYFFSFHLLGMKTLVLHRDVEVARVRRWTAA